MKKIILPLAIISTMLFACSTDHSHEQKDDKHGLEPLAYTLYSDKTELFVEFKPLVVGNESKFAAHFTKLGDYFKAYTEGTILLTLTVNGKSLSVKSTEPSNPGIFRFALKPNSSGIGTLVFEIQTKEFSDKITIDSVPVYADEKTAMENQPEETGVGDISYLKEQAWKVDFANSPVRKQVFSDIIKTSGQILSAPGDEMIVTAKASGIVLFSGNKTIIGSDVSKGTNLFIITGGDLAEGNIDAKYKEAKSNYDKAKAEYDRSKELIKDKIISEKDFLHTKFDFENAQNTFNTIAKNYSANGQNISTTMPGFVKNIFVIEGQFVEAGTPLATISKNKKLILQANVSQKYFNKLTAITSANFKTTDSEIMYNTQELNGKVISYGKSASSNSPFIPVTFEIDNTGNLIPGSVAEVYLKSTPIPDVLAIPVSSLIEEQGNFFVYVQTEGESFQKREIKIGASDGVNVQLLSGVLEGERVVTKGAYQIKLSTASGTLPKHGHEH
ncbi:MAG: efflux transporter periplasmic adaptor subunit [Bacteroidetes bacterium RIFCSPLOWO2_12_FULL_35_15]|nr:MAG: efflux transporter periplasmic adaptor subunit [Bacteroidetes bacterium RIFCSPLOWO2_12_FULL_35_15]